MKDGTTTDKWTGKPVPEIGRQVAQRNGEYCDVCGTELIDRCPVCGAPVCCPRCCVEDNPRLIKAEKYHPEVVCARCGKPKDTNQTYNYCKKCGTEVLITGLKKINKEQP